MAFVTFTMDRSGRPMAVNSTHVRCAIAHSLLDGDDWGTEIIWASADSTIVREPLDRVTAFLATAEARSDA